MTDPFASTSPLAALAGDREAARAAGDPNADLGFVATADTDGTPSVRTLVLRQIDDEWALFLNATSAKWSDLAVRPRCEIAIWLSSVQRQWRLGAQVRPLPGSLLVAHWPRRPRIAQVMDHLYSQGHPQGAPLADRAQLLATHDELDAALADPPPPPADALALALEITSVDCVQIARPPELHRRRCWHRAHGAAPWASEERVP